MIKSIVKASILFAGVALAACSGGQDQANSSSTGSVSLALQIPDGQSVDTINLNLVCPAAGIDQNHVLNVVNGTVVASFGGLTPGPCTATMGTETATGTNCDGSAAFVIVAGQTVPVEVTLTCQGVNMSDDGAAEIVTKFDRKACTDDRIKQLYAIPSNLLLGESTTVQVETFTAAVQGTPTLTFSVRNDTGKTGQGSLAAGTCATGSAGCQAFTCTGLGQTPGVDARTGLPASGVYVSVKYEDADCFDTEEVLVTCLQGSVCGDGNVEGVEQCDDGNTASDDGCSAICVVESCGDGIKQANEVCDGTDGVPAGAGCSATCDAIVVAPVCGDGSKNQASEECDGTDGVLAGQTCGADCKIVAVCGNGIVEGSEQCDDTSASCVNCQTVSVDLCGQCIAALPDIGEFNANVCQPNEQCAAALTCLRANTSCWTTIAPAACYCGNTQADIDGCENPSFVPTGDCAAQLKAGAGDGATNADVLNRYFDFDYPTGHAGIIFDSAFSGCNAQCF